MLLISQQPSEAGSAAAPLREEEAETRQMRCLPRVTGMGRVALAFTPGCRAPTWGQPSGGRCTRSQRRLLTPGWAQLPTCEDLAPLGAAGLGLHSGPSWRSRVDTAVGPGQQAAPGNGVDTLTPKCVVGQADAPAPSGLRAKDRNRNLL